AARRLPTPAAARDAGSSLLVAARFVRSRGDLRLTHHVASALPEGLSPADPEAFGRWVGETLGAAGIAGKRIVWVAPRSSVTIQRLSPPPALEDAELRAFARLQLKKHGVVEPAGAAIGVRRPDSSGSSEDAVAVAMPRAALDAVRSTMHAAGRTLEGVRIRADGLGKLAEDRNATLVVFAAPKTVEIVLTRDGAPRFVREAELDADVPRARAIAVEIRRTRMAARAAGVEMEGAEARLLDASSEPAAPGDVMEHLGEPVAPMPTPEWLRACEDAVAVAPLAGVAAIASGDGLDLLAPLGVSRAAQRRRTLLLALAAVLVLGVGGWMVSQRELSALQSDLDTQLSEARELQERYVRMLTLEARVRHLETWLKLEPDWAAHLSWLHQRLPPREQLLLDDVRGVAEGEVAFEPEKRGVFTGGVWSPQREVGLTLTGRLEQRDAMNRLRADVLASGVYRLEPRGADEPDRFSWRLSTTDATPDGEGGS
ncbi:MAG: hypothetical protein AAGK04_09220, partial [Planctomycetota bacterium]